MPPWEEIRDRWELGQIVTVREIPHFFAQKEKMDQNQKSFRNDSNQYPTHNKA